MGCIVHGVAKSPTHLRTFTREMETSLKEVKKLCLRSHKAE